MLESRRMLRVESPAKGSDDKVDKLGASVAAASHLTCTDHLIHTRLIGQFSGSSDIYDALRAPSVSTTI